jgi:ABC-type multidrug transport system ATPase subunit
VLALHNITLQVGKEPAPQTLLKNLSLHIPEGQLVGIVGPAGSGKSTLVKVIAGLYIPTEGTVHWEGRNLAEEDLAPYDIGYVPQFSIAFDHLTIRESMYDALRLRVRGLSVEECSARAESILREVGILPIADRRVKVLSGGEKRRLGLALELVSFPSLLIADEVTSGLDPKSEEDIMNLMHRLTRERDRIVLAVTHNLRHISLCDSVLVMHQGSLVYHGPTAELLDYFEVSSPEEVFPKLATLPPEHWHEAWQTRQAGHESAAREEESTPAPEASGEAVSKPVEKTESKPPEPSSPSAHNETPRSTRRKNRITTPGAVVQFLVLLRRRWKIFFRDGSQVWLHLALLLGFPCLVVIFALDGLPQIQNLSMTSDVNVLDQLREANQFIIESTKIGRLVSGLVVMQVVLLTLMGSNNSAREIAGERLIYEKEKLGGLRPLSYLASKACFLFVLVAVQSFWMALFVNRICQFPGDLFEQISLLFLANAAMTATCLAISSLMRSPEQASLVSIYLVGFQLPLSGAVLGLPSVARWMTRPFIAAYWSWSGVLQTMRDTRFYDVVQLVTPTDLSSVALCFWALCCHIFIGLIVAYLGCKQSRWD